MSNNIGFLTISDIHMTDKQFGRRMEESKFCSVESFYDKLEMSIKKESKEKKITLRYILLLGDASDYALETEFEKVTTILEDLCEAFNISKENVIIIPGNHDMSRIECWRNCYNNRLREEQYIEHQEYKFRAFKNFYDNFYKSAEIIFDPDKVICRSLYDKEINVVFIGINTIYKDSFREEDHIGYINYKSLGKELEEIRKKHADATIIALMHHTAQSLGSQGPLIQNWNNILTLFKKYHVNIYLGGHAHTTDGLRASTDEDMYYITIGSLSSTEKDVLCSYTILEYKQSQNVLDILPFVYVGDWNSGYWNEQQNKPMIKVIKL